MMKTTYIAINLILICLTSQISVSAHPNSPSKFSEKSNYKTQALNLSAFYLILRSKVKRYCEQFHHCSTGDEQDLEAHRKNLLNFLKRISKLSTISEAQQSNALKAIKDLKSIEKLRNKTEGTHIPWSETREMLVKELQYSTIVDFDERFWKLQKIPLYPFTTCFEIQLARDVKIDKVYKHKHYTGKIKRVLLNQPLALSDRKRESTTLPSLEIDESFTFRMTSDSAESSLRKNFLGTNCIIGFNLGEKDDEPYPLYTVRFPLGKPPYSIAKIEDLRAKLIENMQFMKDMKAHIEAYMKSEWPKKLIKKYCRPETRYFPLGQRLVPLGPFQLSGRLYPESEDELGEVLWRGSLDEDGKPLEFELAVTRGDGQIWILSESQPPTVKLFSHSKQNALTDDEIIKITLKSMMNGGHFLYSLVHFKPNEKPAGYQNLRVKVLNLEHDKSGSVTGFSAILRNGQILTSTLSKDLQVSNLLLNGKPNKYWSAIFSELNQNIDLMYKDPSLQNRI